VPRAQIGPRRVWQPERIVKKVTVGRVLELLRDRLQLEPAGDAVATDRVIESPDVSSPGLVLAGYVSRFPANRLLVLGQTEISYLGSLERGERDRVLALFFSHAVPCVFVTKALPLPEGVLEAAGKAGVPIYCSPLKTAEFYRRIKPVLEAEFAPTVTMHGSLADVFGVGLLFVGKSGIGKSECVLDLVERGHRLVADDVVMVTRRGNDVLIARGHELQRHFMEIRGVGLIDVRAIFGIRAVRQQKRIEVVVQLAEWNQTPNADRTGLDTETVSILGVDLPRITIPLNPGKNITVVAEVIAMNHLLRYSGVNSAEQFNDQLKDRMRAATGVREAVREAAREVARRGDVRQYLEEDDE
jgi:HPr kinase/phosphorylase